MLNKQTISETQAHTKNNPTSLNKNQSSVITDPQNESTPRNQSYLSQATEQAKNFLFPENDDSKYPYPEEESTDNIVNSKNNDNEMNTTRTKNNKIQDKSNLKTSKKGNNYIYGSMVDSVITDKDVEESERRIRELAAEKRRGSVSKPGQTSLNYSSNNSNNNNNNNTIESTKSGGGLLSKIPFGHRKSKSEETDKSNNLNKKTYTIPDENQYMDSNINNRNYSKNNNSNYVNNISNRDNDNIDIKSRPNQYNPNIDFGNRNIEYNDVYDYNANRNSRKYESEIDPSTELYENNSNLKTGYDDNKYQKNYDNGLNYGKNKSENIYVSDSNFNSRDYDDSKFSGNNYLNNQNANKYNLNDEDNYNHIDNDINNNNSDNKNNDESLLTKLKNYITGNEKQEESSNDALNDDFDTDYNQNKASSNYDELIDNNNNQKYNKVGYDTSENMSSNAAFVSNPNVYNSKTVNNRNKNNYSNVNSTKSVSNQNMQNPSSNDYAQTKGVTLRNQNQNMKTTNYGTQANNVSGLQDMNSNKNDITTNMFGESEPYRMVQDQDNKAYLKPEYSKGLKINEKRSNLIDNEELDTGFQSDKYKKKNNFVGGNTSVSPGAINPNALNYSKKDGMDKVDVNKRSLGESTNVNNEVNSNNYDGYYAGTKSKPKYNSLNQTPISYPNNNFNDNSRESKIKSGEYYNDLSHNSNNAINKRTNDASDWKSSNIIGNNSNNIANSSSGNQIAGTNKHSIKNTDYNNKPNYIATDHQRLSDIKEPTTGYNKNTNYSATTNKQMGRNDNYDLDQNNVLIGEANQNQIPSNSGGFVKGKNGIYEYEEKPTENITNDRYGGTGIYDDNDHTKSKDSEHKGLNKIKNLFTNKDKKTKKDVSKTNIDEHGTVYHPTNNRNSSKSEANANTNFVNPNSPTNKNGEKFRDVDYSTSAANKSYNDYYNKNNTKNTNPVNQTKVTETPPGYNENNYGVGKVEHHRKKSLIENIKDAF